MKLKKQYSNPIETASAQEIKELQTARLLKTVRHVYENTSFYRSKFNERGITPDDIKSLDDLHMLPFTEKKDLRDNYPYGLITVPLDRLARVHASSGTTGKQVVAGYTDNDIGLWSDCTARAIVAAGGCSSDFIHIAYGYGLFTGGLGIHAGAEKLGAAVIPVSSGNTARQIQILSDFGSDILCCTPSYALYIGEAVREKGIDPASLKLRAGIFGAEPWTENMRRQIEDTLKIKAYDIYGLTEVIGPGVAYECECQNGMHICEDHFLPEIIDPETLKPLPEGARGELVFTTISKEAMPLLRYRTRDITSLTRDKCPCGRTLVKINRLTGRSDDMLIIRGVNVFPSQIESVLLEIQETSPHYMIVVDRVNNLDTLEVQVEVGSDTDFDAVRKLEEKERRIKAAIESVLGVSLKVRLVSPKTITRSEGKAVRVLDKRKTL